MLDLVAIAQSAPGAIAVNGAIVVGYKLAGIIGTIVAIIATILPPFIVITIISFFYEVFRDNQIVSLVLEGMQVGVAAVIASVVWEMAAGILFEKKWIPVLIMLGSLIAAACLSINAVAIILVCIVIGLIRTFAGTERRRLCRYTSDPGSGCLHTRMALHERVHGSDYDLSDDAGTDRRQFRYFCGD